MSESEEAPFEIALPDGFAPKNIAIDGRMAFVGSRPDGAIVKVDLVSRQVSEFSPANEGTPAVGLAVDDRGRLFVGDGRGSAARVFDTKTGELIRKYAFEPGAFLSDGFYSDSTVWFIDAFKPLLYKLPIRADGQLPDAPEAITISGGGFNADDTPNGLTLTPDGKSLIIGNTNSGNIFRVDPKSGRATRLSLIDDLGASVQLTSEDSLRVVGNTLYAVENAPNTILAFSLNATGTLGTRIGSVADPRFDGPSDFAIANGRMWVVNSREAHTATTPTTTYSLVSVSSPKF